MRIGIAGAGGLGSNVAFNLVRTGVGKLKIVDFDEVDNSNLNRQFYFKDQVGHRKVRALYENLKRINPSIDITIVDRKLEKENINEIFSDCDIIVEAFDKNIYKSMLIEEFLKKKKLIVASSGIAHYDLSNIQTRQLRENLYVVGDFEKDIKDFGTYSPKVLIVASTMANIVLEKGGFYAGNHKNT